MFMYVRKYASVLDIYRHLHDGAFELAVLGNGHCILRGEDSDSSSEHANV